MFTKKMAEKLKAFHTSFLNNTVDGKNPAPPGI